MTLSSLNELKQRPGTGKTSIILSGGAELGDSLAGIFVWDALSEETPDDDTIVKVTNVNTGRWKRINEGDTTASILSKIGNGSKINPDYLPSYVDDVLEVTDFASLPSTGEASKIYIVLDTNKIYRWSGSTYIEVSAGSGDVAGPNSSTANGIARYNGVTGKIIKSSAVTISDDGEVVTTDDVLETTVAPYMVQVKNSSGGGTRTVMGLANFLAENSARRSYLYPNRILFEDISNTAGITVKIPDDVIGTSKTIVFPNASGTVALLSDIPSSAAAVTPGGTNQQLQYNNGGNFAGITNAIYTGSQLRIGDTNNRYTAISSVDGHINNTSGISIDALTGLSPTTQTTPGDLNFTAIPILKVQGGRGTYIILSSSSTTNNVAGDGQYINIISGNGGVFNGNTTLNGTGGPGGRLDIQSGTGGQSINSGTGTQIGGTAGTLRIMGGTGGRAGSNGTPVVPVGIGASGGNISILSGGGGEARSTTTSTGGKGGNLLLETGVGGNTTNATTQTPGSGGDLIITLGTGGSSSNDTPQGATGKFIITTVLQNTTGAHKLLSRNASTGVIELVDPSTLGGSGTVTSGTYTPTFTGITNIASPGTIHQCQYTRINNIVTVYGKVSINMIASGGDFSEFRLTLPIASDIDGETNSLHGVAVSQEYITRLDVHSHILFDEVAISFYAANSNCDISFSFSYVII